MIIPYYITLIGCPSNRSVAEWTCGMIDMIGSFRATKTPADSRNGIRSTSLVGFLLRIICIIFFGRNEIVFGCLIVDPKTRFIPTAQSKKTREKSRGVEPACDDLIATIAQWFHSRKSE